MSDQNSNHEEPNSNQEDPPKNNETETEKPKKLKILAFHGYRQNGAVFRGKIGSFRKAVNKYAQLTFISAPHRVVNDDGTGDEGKTLSPLQIFLNKEIICFFFVGLLKLQGYLTLNRLGT